MKIETRNFGILEVDPNIVINFKEGLPGFEEEKEFIVIEGKDSPFHWLQSVKTSDLAFVIINPFEIFKDYDIKLPKTALEKLKIEKEEDVVTYSIVVIPEDIREMTANLSGPIIINLRERLAKQVILEDDRYGTKHLVFQEDKEEIGG